MNKQTTAFVVIILITCLLGYGVDSMFNMTALERLETTMTSNVQLESYRMDATGNMNMSLESEDEIPGYLQQAFKMYDNMELHIQADIITKPDNFQMKMLESVDMGGMKFDVEIYLKDQELLVKYPILGNYISITLEDLKEVTGIKLPDNFEDRLISLLPEMQEDMATISKTYFTEENVKYVEPYNMVNDGYEQKLNVVQIDIDSEMIVQIYADMILSLIENENGLALVKEVVELNGETLPEDFETKLDELKGIVQAVKNPDSDERAMLYDEIGPILDNLKYTYSIGFSNLNIPKMIWMNMDMTLPMDGFDEVNMRIVYNVESRLSKFNEIDSIEMPEIDESDITRISELIDQFGGF